MHGGKAVSPEDQRGLLDPSELGEGESALLPRTLHQNVRTGLLSNTVTAIVALALGILIGYLLQPGKGKYGLLYPSGDIERYFEPNETFTRRPDHDSEAAWASLFPIGRGFIHHDEIAPFISSVSVFHQLHCLHAMVVAYYDALEAPSLKNDTLPPDWDDPTLTRIAIPHIRHCFEYLRQSIMCASDTNLEDLDHKTHKANGWGQTKTCRNHDSVFAWVEQYANSSDTGAVT